MPSGAEWGQFSLQSKVSASKMFVKNSNLGAKSPQSGCTRSRARPGNWVQFCLTAVIKTNITSRVRASKPRGEVLQLLGSVDMF
jgi:hypothetical protein